MTMIEAESYDAVIASAAKQSRSYGKKRSDDIRGPVYDL
jgi:hypothetical protein